MARDKTMFNAKTYSVPALAMRAPATSGPIIREAFIAIPFKARAAGNCSRLTKSGIMAAKTGQRIAKPIPFIKVSTKSNSALKDPTKVKKHNKAATPANQICVITKYFFRLTISARAPLGKPIKKTGRLDAV